MTDRKVAEQRQRFLLLLSDRLRLLGEPQSIMDAAVEALGQHLRASRVGYGQVQPGGESIALQSSYTDGVEPLKGVFPLAGFGVHNLAQQRLGVTVVWEDVAADSASNPESWAAIDTRSFVSVPLVRDGEFRASLYLNQSAPRRWSPEEVSLIEDVAARTWEALERATAEETQHKAETALRGSEAQYRVLIESLPQLVWTCLPDGRCDYLSSQWVDFTGVAENEQLDLKWGLIV